MQRHVDQELADLRAQILRMGALVEEQIEGSIKALVDRDVDLASRIIERDTLVNNLDVERLITLQQFLAVIPFNAENFPEIVFVRGFEIDLAGVGAFHLEAFHVGSHFRDAVLGGELLGLGKEGEGLWGSFSPG